MRKVKPREYKFLLTATANGKCRWYKLHKAVRASNIATFVHGVRKDDTHLYVEFSGKISKMERDILNQLVADHEG